MINSKKTFRKALKKHVTRGMALGIALVLILSAFSFVFIEQSHAEPSERIDETAGQTDAAEEGVGAFEVTGYTLDAKVGRDHSYKVAEKIRVNLPDQLDKIEFAIPSGNFRLSDLTVENTYYEAKKASEASTVSIVDKEKLSKGPHEYTITYRIREYQDKDSAKDMFYFNVLLPEWRQPIGYLDIMVTFPEDFPWDDMHCYSGQFGVQDSANKIHFSANEKKKLVKITGSKIPENFGITLKAQLPEGYWEGALNNAWAASAVMLSMAGAAVLLLMLWLIGGRDPKVKKEPVTRPLDDVKPVELGYIFNSHVEIRDILHMLLDFARKGYMRISEYEPKKFSLYKVKEPVNEERMYRTAYNTLFEDVYIGRSIDMEDIGLRLELITREISDDVAAGFTSSDSLAFTPLSRAFRYAGAVILGAALALANAFSYVYEYVSINFVESLLIGIAAAALSILLCTRIDRRDSSSISAGTLAEITSGFLLAVTIFYTAFRVMLNTGDTAIAAGIVVLGGISAFLIVIMRARGRENAEKVSKIRQLREFIYHPTPKELLENHLADEDYYYEMMIYALAFGAEEAWAISFLTLDVPEPDWYTEDIEGHAFTNLRGKSTTIDYARDLRSFIRTVENAYSDMERRRGRR